MYMLDPSGIVANWNAGAQRLKGYRLGGNYRPAFLPVLHEGGSRGGLPVRVLEMAAREGRYETEGWRMRKDGSRFWASVVVDAIRDERQS